MENNITFTLFQWNTLCNILAHKKSFPYVEEKFLEWKYREPLLKKIINENKADVICLEEVGNFEDEFKNEILDKCEIKYDLIFERRENKIMGNVIGVNKDLFEIEKYDKIFLEQDNEGKEKKINIISAFIKEKKTKNIFVIIATHLKAKEQFEEVRKCQMRHLMRYIEENILGKFPFFIPGDFNAEPNYESISNLMSNQKIKIKSVFDFSKIEMTTIKMRDKLYKRIIDYIFYCGKNNESTEKEIEILSKEIANTPINEKIGLPNENFPSDHLFLKAKIKLSFI